MVHNVFLVAPKRNRRLGLALIQLLHYTGSIALLGFVNPFYAVRCYVHMVEAAYLELAPSQGGTTVATEEGLCRKYH